jgi:simple sugar transport system ATP-binding protein
MAGGQELAELSHELRSADPGKVVQPHNVQHGTITPPDLDTTNPSTPTDEA